jgi:hypothetical protein
VKYQDSGYCPLIHRVCHSSCWFMRLLFNNIVSAKEILFSLWSHLIRVEQTFFRSLPRNSHLLWSCEVLLSCSQEPAAGLSMSQLNNQSTVSHPVYVRSIIIWFTHVLLCFPSSRFSSGLKVVCVCIYSISRAFHIPHLIRSGRVAEDVKYGNIQTHLIIRLFYVLWAKDA